MVQTVSKTVFRLGILASAVLSLAACSTTSGSSSSGARVPSVQAVAFFSKLCLGAPYDNAANIAGMRAESSLVPTGKDFVTDTSNSVRFKHASLDLETAAGALIGKPSCSVTYRPDGPKRKSAVDAAILMTALADPGARPSGLKGQGVINWAYKGGRLSLFARQNSPTISLIVSKL